MRKKNAVSASSTQGTWSSSKPASAGACQRSIATEPRRNRTVATRAGPRVRREARAGSAVTADFHALRPGDLMMFAEPGQAISHVAIYAGDGRIIHASSSVGGVGYTDLNAGGDWFVDYFVAARRVL